MSWKNKPTHIREIEDFMISNEIDNGISLEIGQQNTALFKARNGIPSSRIVIITHRFFLGNCLVVVLIIDQHGFWTLLMWLYKIMIYFANAVV